MFCLFVVGRPRPSPTTMALRTRSLRSLIRSTTSMHPLTFLSALALWASALSACMRFTSPRRGGSNRRVPAACLARSSSIDFSISSVPILRYGLVVLLSIVIRNGRRKKGATYRRCGLLDCERLGGHPVQVQVTQVESLLHI